MRITTGHATTIATILLTVGRALREAHRSMDKEAVAMIGLGSIGIQTNSTYYTVTCTARYTLRNSNFV